MLLTKSEKVAKVLGTVGQGRIKDQASYIKYQLEKRKTKLSLRRNEHASSRQLLLYLSSEKLILINLSLMGQVSEWAVAERVKSNRNQTSISLKYCQDNLA